MFGFEHYSITIPEELSLDLSFQSLNITKIKLLLRPKYYYNFL
jgi:hypothetical protein